MVDRLLNSEANLRRIALIERGFGCFGIPLVVPGRVLVGEGTLTKICRKGPKPRKFFLFNDILVYCNIVIERKKYTKQRVLPLEHIYVESMPDSENYQNCFVVRTVRKSFVVRANNRNVKRQWLLHIRRCIDDVLRKTGKEPPTLYAAVMMPNASATYCMHCRECKFNFFERRHHCRKCGKVVCAACSRNKHLLPLQSSKPQRVCNRCYAQLKVIDRPKMARRMHNISAVSTSSCSSCESASSIENTLPGIMHHQSHVSNRNDGMWRVKTVTTYFYRLPMDVRAGRM